MVAICWWDLEEVKHVFTQNKSSRIQPAAHEITALSHHTQMQLRLRSMIWWRTPVASLVPRPTLLELWGQERSWWQAEALFELMAFLYLFIFLQSSQSHCLQGSHDCAVTSFICTGGKRI